MTIHWLVQNTAAYPELERGTCAEGWLNAAELRHFDALRTLKRQREWLLGRLTAKQLLQTLIQSECGEYRSLEQLTIINAPNGAPIVTGTCFEHAVLSVSHRADHAFCAAVLQSQTHQDGLCALGADIELIEPRGTTFAEDYFTESELRLLMQTPKHWRDAWITAIWSAKEAALKAVHVGLNLDTRAVSCLIEPIRELPLEWTPIQIEWDAARVEFNPPALVGWWRAQGQFVLTLAANSAPDMLPNPEATLFNEQASK